MPQSEGGDEEIAMRPGRGRKVEVMRNASFSLDRR